MNTFNVEEFNTLIDNIITITNKADASLKNISSYIEEMKTCINEQENTYLYQGWTNVRETVHEISRKFFEKKENFISNLLEYKNHTITSNDVIYQDVQRAIDYLNEINQKLGSI
ncbi:MAG: hypothetical protein IJZ46_03570 [Bacilli bacterium]|nr:hypothetical protein [Bacilli bacterium]